MVATRSTGACTAIRRACSAVFAWITNAISASREATAWIGLASPKSAVLPGFTVFVVAAGSATPCDAELAGCGAVGVFEALCDDGDAAKAVVAEKQHEPQQHKPQGGETSFGGSDHKKTPHARDVAIQWIWMLALREKISLGVGQALAQSTYAVAFGPKSEYRKIAQTEYVFRSENKREGV